MLRMPQSPRWLVMAGRDFEARATLARLRSGDPETIEQEIVEIKDEVAAKPGTWSDLGRPVVRAALVVGIGLAILQQVCRDQHGHLLRADDHPVHRHRLLGGRDPRLGRASASSTSA